MGKRTEMSPTHLISVTTAKMFETIAKKRRVNENSNCSEGQMRADEVTWGPHYGADATMAVPGPYSQQL